MRAILLIAVLAPAGVQADVVTLKKTDGTTLTGEYVGTKRDGTTIFVQLKVGAETEQHPIADFTASAKRKITRLNRAAHAQAEKAEEEARAEAEKAQAEAKEAQRRASAWLRDSQLLQTLFPPQIEAHNNEIITQQVLAFRHAGEIHKDAAEARLAAFLKLKALVVVHFGQELKPGAPDLEEQLQVLTPVEVIYIHALLQRGAGELLVNVPGKEPQAWKDMWLQCQEKEIVGKVAADASDFEAATHALKLLDESAAETEQLNWEALMKLHQGGFGFENEPASTKMTAWRQLWFFVLAYSANQDRQQEIFDMPRMLNSLTPIEIANVNALVDAGAGELLVITHQHEPQAVKHLWAKCLELVAE